jgi:hypothetical protein
MEDAGAELARRGRLIEGLRSLVERYVGEHDRAQAEDSFAAMARHVRERIRLEEKSLFPALEQLGAGADFEPTRRMRRQHVVLLEMIDGLEQSIARGAWTTALFDVRELHAALKLHHEEEQRVLFPILGAQRRGHA